MFAKIVSIFGASPGPSEPTRESVFVKPPIKLNDDLYEIHSGSENPSVEIVFFHGFEIEDSSDAYWKDWLSGDRSHCWLGSWLAEDFPEARILSVRYDSSLTQGRMDVSDVAANLASTLVRLRGRVGRGECPVILVGHSVGGLVMKQLLVTVGSFSSTFCQHSDRILLGLFLNKVRALFFYATPHFGSNLGPDTIGNSASSGPFLKSLEMSDHKTHTLHEKFLHLRSKYKWRLSAVGEVLETKLVTKLGRDFFHGIVVEGASASLGMYGRFNLIRTDHMNICKPDAKTDLSFLFLLDFIENTMYQEKNCGQQCEGLPDYPVGLDRWMSELREKMRLWCPGQGGSQGGIVGIVGKAGIGKTSLARGEFNEISRAFEYTCFVDSVKNIPNHDLQNQILCNFHRNGERLADMERISWNDLERSTVLLVMDDVDSMIDQLKVLPSRFRESLEGSLLIFTNSGDSLWRSKYKNYFEVELLNHDDARRLFCLHAFGSDDIPEKQLVLKAKIERLVEKCGGLPRSLENMGQYLCGKDEKGVIWEGAIDYFEKTYLTEQDQSIVVPEESHDPDNLQYFTSSEVELVGLAPRVDELRRLLMTDQKVAIVGFGGMGKTTLAKKLFNTINSPENYDYTGFFPSVQEQLSTSNNVDLRDKILGNLCKRGKKLNRENLKWSNLKGQRVLLVLDDVNSTVQPPDFMDEFAKESRLIVTSRSDSFLRGFSTYDIERLDPENSKKLFCICAFGGNPQDEALQEIQDKLLKKCDGLPLTLEAVGSALYEREYEIWEEMLRKIEAQENLDGSDKNTWAMIIRSCYDVLGPEEKEMFLDVAVFIPAFQSFKALDRGFRFADYKRCWDRMYKVPHTSWENLKARRLVREAKSADNWHEGEEAVWMHEGEEAVWMHEHFRDLGCKLACPQDTDPKSHLRICWIDCPDVIDFSLDQSHEGNFNAKAVVICNTKWKHPEVDLRVDLTVFSRFLDLRFLTLRDVRLVDGLGDLPRNLAVLHVDRCDSPGPLFVSFNAKCLVDVRILFPNFSSLLTDTPGLTKALRSPARMLRCLHIAHPHYYMSSIRSGLFMAEMVELLKCLDPEYLPALEELTIDGCDGVVKFPDSLSNLECLRTVRIKDCEALEELPSFRRLSSLKMLDIENCPRLKSSPVSAGVPASLIRLSLRECESLAGNLWGPVTPIGDASKLQHLTLYQIKGSFLPDAFSQLRALESVEFWSYYELTILPVNFGGLRALRNLEIKDCEELETLDSVNWGGLFALSDLWIGWCPLLKKLPGSFGELSALSTLRIQECCMLDELPESFGRLSTLRSLFIYKCPMLKELPESFGHLRWLQILKIEDCYSLQSLSEEFWLLPSLQMCSFSNCKKLRTRSKSVVRLTALEKLKVWKCPLLEPLRCTISRYESKNFSEEFASDSDTYGVGSYWKWKKQSNPIGLCFSSLEDGMNLFESSRGDGGEK